MIIKLIKDIKKKRNNYVLFLFLCYIIYDKEDMYMELKNKLNILIVLNAICFGLMGIFNVNILAIVSLCNLLLYYKSVDGLRNKKDWVLTIAFINVFTFKWVSAAFSFSVYSQLKEGTHSENKTSITNNKVASKKQVDPQIRKVDILLKLGVAMIFIAGFVFATTGWYSLNSIIKIFIFLLVAALFIGLSKFCEKKIKILSTIYLYWFLGMTFILLVFVTAGYSCLFGDYFSLMGDGSYFYCAFCCLIFSILNIITYYNFKEKIFLNLVYLGVLCSITFILIKFGLVVEEIIMLLLPVLTFIRMIKIDSGKDIHTLSIFSNIVMCFLGLIFIIYIGTYINIFAVVGLSVLFIFNVYHYIYLNRDSDFNIFAAVLSYLFLIPTLIIIFNENICAWVLITTFFVTILYLISLLFNNIKLKTSSLVTADIITILVFVISASGSIWLPLVVSLFSGFICCICTFIEKLDDYSFEIQIHPVKVSMLLFGIIYLLNSYFGFSNVLGYWLSFTLLLFILIYCLSRNKALTEIYEKFSIIAIVISLMFTLAIPNLIISIVIFISIVLFYADVNWTKDYSSKFKNFVFVLLLFNIFISSHAIENSIFNYGDTNYLFANIVSIILFISVAIFHKNDETKLNLSLFAVIIPIITLVEINIQIEWLSIILPSVFVYYLTFMISRMLKNNVVNKNIIGYLGYSLSFLLVIFNDNYYVLAFSFILIIVSLVLGYLDKSFNALFKVSAIALIVEVLYQLKEFWNLIPAWLYLLLFGLSLVIFATYKQLKITEKSENKDKDNKK